MRQHLAYLLGIFVGQINRCLHQVDEQERLHHECRRVRRSQSNGLLLIRHFPGERAGSDVVRKDCITNLDELPSTKSLY